MYCSQCGKELLNGSKFCGNCGAAVNMNASEQELKVKDVVNVQPTNTSSKKKNKTVLGVVIAIAIALVLVVGLVVSNMNKHGFNNYKDLVDAYFEAIEDNKPKLLKRTMNEEMLEALMDYADLKYIDLEKQLDLYFSYVVSEARSMYDDNLKIVHKISDVETLDDYDREYYVEDLIDECGFKESEIGPIKEIDVDLLINGEKDSEYLTVAKIKGKWYLIDASIF